MCCTFSVKLKDGRFGLDPQVTAVCCGTPYSLVNNTGFSNKHAALVMEAGADITSQIFTCQNEVILKNDYEQILPFVIVIMPLFLTLTKPSVFPGVTEKKCDYFQLHWPVFRLTLHDVFGQETVLIFCMFSR
jgi:hypothetical protein